MILFYFGEIKCTTFQQLASSTPRLECRSYYLNSGRFVVSTEKLTHYHDYLESNGFVDKNIQVVTRTEQILGMLLKGRSELILSTEQNLMNQSERAGISYEQFEKVLLAYHVQEYMALSGPSPESLANRIKNTYRELSEAGKISLK